MRRAVLFFPFKHVVLTEFQTLLIPNAPFRINSGILGYFLTRNLRK